MQLKSRWLLYKSLCVNNLQQQSPLNPTSLSLPRATNLTFMKQTQKNSPLPSSYQKLGKREEIPKKMRNFVGAFDCIDKLKYALRQPFAQQKQLSTPRIQRLGSRAHNKEKEKNNET